MPTLGAATQSNPWLMAFYRQLTARGKPSKVALIAAVRKLLAAIYSSPKIVGPSFPSSILALYRTLISRPNLAHEKSLIKTTVSN
jgi:hypothetical protein